MASFSSKPKKKANLTQVDNLNLLPYELQTLGHEHSKALITKGNPEINSPFLLGD